MQPTHNSHALIPYKEPSQVVYENYERWRQRPCIVYLKGTSSAGKSTFGRSLELRSREWVFIDEDILYIKNRREFIAQHFPQEFASASSAIATSNLYHAFFRRVIEFRKDAGEAERATAQDAVTKVHNELENPQYTSLEQDAKHKIQSELADTIQKAFQEGKKVLLDSRLFTPAEVGNRFPEARVIRLLFYCPLPIALEHLHKRNQECHATGNMENHRFTGQLMGSFCNLYSLSKKPTAPIEAIERSVFETPFQAMLQDVKKANTKGPRKLFISEEMPEDLFEKTKMQFLQPYKTEGTDVLAIEPKETFDLLVNNSGNTQNAFDYLLTRL